jgi:hypothetical protein
MANREKTTITVDRARLDAARVACGNVSASKAIDIALDRLLRTERLRSDLLAYGVLPPTPDEIAIGRLRPDYADIEDDTDWEALYADGDA